MNKTQKILIGFCLTLTSAIACLVTVQPTQAADPVYDGKALSEWLLALHADLNALPSYTGSAARRGVERVAAGLARRPLG